MQTRRRSLKEAVINVSAGYSINFCANLAILPLFGFDVTVGQNLALGVIYTGISIARTYTVRRLFNRGDHRPAP